MKDRQLFGGSSFPPDVLSELYDAFDAAWAEVTPDVSIRPEAIEVARSSLATIVLSIAGEGRPIDREAIKRAAVDAFRLKHRMTGT